MGSRVRAGGRLHADCGDGADAGCRRLAGVAAATDRRRADQLCDVSVAADLADVCGGLGAVADRARQGRMDAAAADIVRAVVGCRRRHGRRVGARRAAVRGCHVPLSIRRRACGRRRVVRVERGPNARDRRSDRLRQVDAACAAAAPLCAGPGPHRVGWPRDRRLHTECAARCDQLGAAGAVPVLGNAGGEHRACAQQRDTHGDRACGRAGGAARRHRALPARLRNDGGRARHHAFGRAAAKSCDRARAVDRKAAAAARRCVVGCRHWHRNANPGALCAANCSGSSAGARRSSSAIACRRSPMPT